MAHSAEKHDIDSDTVLDEELRMTVRRWTTAGLVGLTLLGNGVEARQREIGAAAANLAQDIADAGRRSVAVVDFTDLQGHVTELGRFVAEEMALGLVMARKNLSLIDRTHLKVLMEENKLSATGLIDPATARQLGKIVGVEVLVTGTITPFPDSVRVVIKVLDTDTARILAASSVDIAKTQTIEALLGRDIAGGSTASAGAAVVPAPSRSGAGTTAPAGPAVQRGPLRVTGQVAVDSANSRASLTVIVENTSAEPVLLAVVAYETRLTDDQARNWSYDSGAGLPMLHNSRTTDRSYYAQIDPREKVTHVVNFTTQSGRGVAGAAASARASTFSFGMGAVMLGSDGPQPVSLGLSGITATVR